MDKIELNNGDITVYNMDCFDLLEKLKNDGVLIDAVITDPPYSLMKSSTVAGGGQHKVESNVDWERVCKESYNLMKDDSFFGFFQLFKTAIQADFFNKTAKAGFEIYDDLIWDKLRSGSPFTVFKRCHETFYIYKRGNPKPNEVRYDHFVHELKNEEDMTEVLKIFKELKVVSTIFKSYESAMDFVRYLFYKTHPLTEEEKARIFNQFKKGKDLSYFDFTNTREPNRNYSSGKKLLHGTPIKSVIRMVSPNTKITKDEDKRYKHPNIKPVELMELIIQQFTNEGDLVVDLFCGSGTTAEACKNTNRRFIGCEIDKEYFEIIKKRLS